MDSIQKVQDQPMFTVINVDTNTVHGHFYLEQDARDWAINLTDSSNGTYSVLEVE